MAEKNNSKAIASMVLGIISIPTSFIPLVGFVLGILAIIFYRKANKLIQENPTAYGGHGMAVAGLVTGIIGLFFSVIYIFYWIFLFSFFGSVIQNGMMYQ